MTISSLILSGVRSLKLPRAKQSQVDYNTRQSGEAGANTHCISHCNTLQYTATHHNVLQCVANLPRAISVVCSYELWMCVCVCVCVCVSVCV